MSDSEIKALARLASASSREGVELIKKGDRSGGHALMRQAYEASKKCQALMNQGKIDKALMCFQQEA